ncbi:MAG: hypothetical protein U5N86_11190 [Planctomycetota bacterium]|nr:hypothetical protein [Planctomycetota bacterium]
MLITLIAVGAAGGGTYAWLRRRKLKQRVDEKLSHSVADLTSKFSSIPGTSAVVGLITAGDVIYHSSQVDPSVLAALELRASEHPGNLYEANQYIEDSLADGASLEGMTNYWQGVTGEMIVANKLSEAGHDVQFAPGASQEGWDLIVDGEVVQVKTAMTDQVSAHFQEYPDISVIASPYDGAVESASLDISGPDVEGVREATENSLDGIENLGDWTFGIPFVTLAISSGRNIGKLVRDEVTGKEAVWFVLQDTVGTGVGAAVGAKVGIAAGSGLGPVGMAAGGLIGGVGGAIFGRKLVGMLRGRKLKRLDKELNKKCRAFVETLCGRRKRIVAGLSDGAQKVWDAVEEKEESRGFWGRLRSFVWPTEAEFIRKRMGERASQSMASVRAKVDRFLSSVSDEEEPVVAFQKACERSNYISAAGLEESVEEIVDLGEARAKEYRRVR